MIKKNVRFFLSAMSLFSTVFVATGSIHAAPVRFNQVSQVINARPGKASNGNYTNLRLTSDPVNDPKNDPKGDKKTESKPIHQDRVITETTFEIVQEESCNCTQPEPKRGFPYWALLGLAAIPVVVIITKRKSPTPPPTQTPPPTETPTTQTPTPTPTPPTEPVPEPMTILLFGTGLAGIGFAARRRFGKRREEDEEDEE